MSGIYLIKAGQKAIYIIRKQFPYHVYLEEGSSVTFYSSIPGGDIMLQGNIWGAGNVLIQANAILNRTIGVAPSKSELKGLTVYEHENDFTESI